ncbi:hypothetical protein HPP92_022797 [Vanilla planifolia]|uniref:Uncharacterized protein n=1 Tax=Vanilla planifolia TaxID=51239 RepID=A0A835UE59_VANPL|nr:hypothetical protein HPP92_022797 [Vanilla planifolia]
MSSDDVTNRYTDDDDYFRRSKRFRADFRPPSGPRSEEDVVGTPSSPGRSGQPRTPRDDFPTTDQTEDDMYEDEYDDDAELNMYRVQGTLREWVTRDEVRRFIANKFKEFLLTYVNQRMSMEIMNMFG